MTSTGSDGAPAGAGGGRRAPGPRGHWLLGSLADYRRDPLGFFLSAAREHGGLVRCRMGHVTVVLVSDPALVKHVLQDHFQRYVKGASYDSLSVLLGQGLLVSEGALWRRQRRLMNPTFSKKHLDGVVPVLDAAVATVAARWAAVAREGRPIDVMEEMLRLALDVVVKTLFGTEIDEHDLARVEAALPVAEAFVYRRLESVVKVPLWVPTPANLRYREAKNTLVSVVGNLVARRRRASEGDGGGSAAAFPRERAQRASEGDGGDLLSTLLAARDEETGTGMSDRQLVDECLTLLLGGHETSGQALAWTWHLLGGAPEVEAALHEELARALGGRAPAAEDLAALRYTSQVVDESLRLYPTAWSFTRRPLEDDEVGGYLVPRGALVVISPYVIHRLASLWPEPERFDPDRFAPERQKGRPAAAYLPFGLGQHMCIGKPFALLEMRHALATLAQRFRLRPVAGHRVEPLPSMTLKARHGILMTIEERR